MRIFGTGVDLVKIERIGSMLDRYGQPFLDRVYAPDEQTYCRSMKTTATCLAARFAAKEAVSKALGCGIGENAAFTEIVVCRAATGKPSIQLSGAAAQFAAENGITEITISLSHDGDYAIAQAIALSDRG